MQEIKIKDEKLLEIINPSLEIAKDLQDKLRKERKDLLASYNLSKEASNIRGLSKVGFSQVVSPVTYEAVEGMKVGLDQLFTAPDFFNVKMGEDAEAGERIRKLLRWNIFEAQYGTRTIRHWLDSTLKYHYGVLKCFWDEHNLYEHEKFPELSLEQAEYLLSNKYDFLEYTENNEQVPSLNPETLQVELVDELSSLSNVKTEKIKRKFLGMKLEAIDPENFFYTPDGSELDDCRLVAQRIKLHIDEIKKGEELGFYRKGSYKKILDNASDEGVQDFYDNTSYRSQISDLEDFHLSTTNKNSDEKDVFLYEIYTKIKIDSELEPVIIKIVDNTVLSVEKNPYKRPPYRISRAIENPFEFEGKPYIKSLMQLQAEITQQTRLFNDSTADSVYGTLVTDDPEFADNWNNRGIGDTILAGHGTIENSKFQVIRPPAVDGAIMQAREYLEGLVERTSGITRYNQGIDANSLNKTATGISLISSLAQQRQKYIAGVISEAWKDTLEDMVEGFRMFGGEYVEYFVKKGIEVNPNDYITDFSINIELGVGPQEKLQQAQVIREMIALAQNGGVQAGLFDVTHISKMINQIGNLSGVPLENYHFSEDEIRQNQQQQQMQQQQAQQMQKQEFAQMQAQDLQKQVLLERVKNEQQAGSF